jgi:hypothetical protein
VVVVVDDVVDVVVGGIVSADTPLTSGVAVRGTLSSFTWHYYHVQLSVGVSALNVTVHQLSRYGDVDVYIQRDTFPTEREYALADTTTDHDMYLQVANPPPGRWYIGLFGYWRVEYSVQADIISMSCCCLSAPPPTAVDFDQHSSRCLVDCPVDCGPHGRCSGRTCLCTEPFVGEACDTCMVCCSVSHTISLVSLTSLPPLSHHLS